MLRNRSNSAVAGERLAESLAGAAIIASLAFGGGSRGMGDAIVVMLSVPVLLLACVRWWWSRQLSSSRWTMMTLIGIVAWHVIQLIPLPVEWVGQLPMRSAVLADFRAAGAAPRWLPATLDFWGTVRSLTGIMVLGALLALFSTLATAARLRLLKLAVLGGCLMALLGYAQAAAGAQSPLRMYSYHHSIGAIGTLAMDAEGGVGVVLPCHPGASPHVAALPDDKRHVLDDAAQGDAFAWINDGVLNAGALTAWSRMLKRPETPLPRIEPLSFCMRPIAVYHHGDPPSGRGQNCGIGYMQDRGHRTWLCRPSFGIGLRSAM